MAPWQEDLNGTLWRSIFYSEFTVVRTAILMPILVIYLVVLMRLVSVRGDNETTMFNRLATTAMGAFLAAAPLRASTTLLSAVVGITILSVLNLCFNALYFYGILPKHSIAPKPTLLVARGQLLHSQMRKVLMSPDKVQSQLRKAGCTDLSSVLAAVMEPDGRCSVIPYGPNGEEPHKMSLLQSVDGYEQFLGRPPNSNHANLAPAGDHV